MPFHWLAPSIAIIFVVAGATAAGVFIRNEDLARLIPLFVLNLGGLGVAS